MSPGDAVASKLLATRVTSAEKQQQSVKHICNHISKSLLVDEAFIHTLAHTDVHRAMKLRELTQCETYL